MNPSTTARPWMEGQARQLDERVQHLTAELLLERQRTEAERGRIDQISELLKLRLDAAKKRGVHCGRPQVELPDPLQVLDLQGQGLGIRRIATRLKTSPWAVRQALKWLKRGPPLELGTAIGASSALSA